MAEKTYTAMFEPTEDGFGISFPDLRARASAPGGRTGGKHPLRG
jgi:hypothetical protein